MVVRPTHGERNSVDRNTFELFDESQGYDDEAGIRFAPDLSPLDRRRATLLYRLFTPPREVTGLWGLCVVYGAPGTGKDLFGNYLTINIKRYFPWKRILRDEPPRDLYGPYGGLFNEQALHDDFAKMRAAGKGLKLAELDAVLEKAADDWLKGAGEVLLKNSVLYKSEFWKDCYKREPHNPMNKTMGAIHKVYRHLDCLVLGTVQTVDDLDRFTAKPYINWRVTCTKSASNPTGFVYYVQRVVYDKRKDVLVPLGQPFPMPVDAGRPRSELGDGRIRITDRGWRYMPETEEERVVLEVLKSGIGVYEDIVDLLETEGDMSEREVSDTIKALGLKLPGKRPKMVLDFPCYYKIYNSKSAPQLKTNVKVLEG
jgi:hypothetical protein